MFKFESLFYFPHLNNTRWKIMWRTSSEFPILGHACFEQAIPIIAYKVHWFQPQINVSLMFVIPAFDFCIFYTNNPPQEEVELTQYLLKWLLIVASIWMNVKVRASRRILLATLALSLSPTTKSVRSRKLDRVQLMNFLPGFAFTSSM